MDLKKVRHKLKQCKYQHLKKIYTKNLSRHPVNCKYNKVIRLPNRSILNICGFNFEDSYEMDICYKPEHAQDCNAFCVYKSKEELFLIFEEELRNDQIRATKYKDIDTLYWLCPELKLEDFPEKRRWYHKLFKFLR